MKLSTAILALCCAASSVFAQHGFQLDDGFGHLLVIEAPFLTEPMTNVTLSGGGNILLSDGDSSLAWLSIGNRLANQGSLTPNWFGTSTNDDVIFKANNIEKMRLSSIGGVSITANLDQIRGVTYQWPIAHGLTGQLLSTDNLGNLSWVNATSGSVSSVGLSLPTEFTITGSPITSSGTLAASWIAKNQHTVFAAPIADNGIPSFRLLDASDFPVLPYVTSIGVSVTDGLTVSGSPITSNGIVSIGIAASSVDLDRLKHIVPHAILGNNTNGDISPIPLSPVETKTLLDINNVENTALSTWSGSSNIYAVGTLTSGTWNGSIIGTTYGGLGINTSTTPTGSLLYTSNIGVWSTIGPSSDGKVLTMQGGLPQWLDAVASGSVTSVGLSLPAEFSINNSPITSSGTINATWASENQHTVFAGPVNGNGAPSFRALELSDLPAMNYLSSVNAIGNNGIAVSGGPITSTGSLTISIDPNSIALDRIVQLPATTLLGNNTGSSATAISLTPAVAKSMLALNNVENTALSTWSGSSAITTLGTITSGIWNGSTITPEFGGTGINTSSTIKGSILYTDNTGTWSTLAPTSNGDILVISSGVPSWQTPAGVSAVSSVGLSLPTEFSITNSPITSSGTIGANWISQTQHTIFAAPSGGNGTPTFRNIEATDLPSLPYLTSVGLSMPTGFSVTSSPITSSGTISVSTTLNGVIHGNGSGFVASAVNLNSEVSNILPIINGGTNISDITNSANKILGVNAGSSGYELKTISGGTNITINNTAGDITINGPSSLAPNGAATGDLSGNYPNPTVATIGGKTSAQVSTAVNDISSATDLATNSTIVKRDASGNFSAAIITASLNGNAATATTATTATNFSGSLSGDVGGTQSSTTVNSVQTSAGTSIITAVNNGSTTGTITANRLPAMGASGASHSSGLVPDPGAAAGTTKFLREDGTWQTPAGGGGGGSGDFSGPSSSLDKAIVRFDGVTGKLGQNSAVTVLDYTTSTQNSSGIKADDGSTADIGLVLSPKGTGALLANQPDGSSSGGNARGSHSTDLQTSRTAATQIASGIYSVIAGGNKNTASGDSSIVVGGTNNTASSTNSAVLAGTGAIASHYGEIAHSTGNFSTQGDAQEMNVMLRATTTNNTVTEMFLDGSGQRLTVPANTAWAFRMEVIGRRTNAAGEAACFFYHGGIRKDGTNSTLTMMQVGATNPFDESGFDDNGTWKVATSADQTNGSLKITVKGENSKTIRWVASVHIIQVQ